jgi:catechol 2,3-dioxygenase-like lactoylglutathione lyase family enzyme
MLTRTRLGVLAISLVAVSSPSTFAQGQCQHAAGTPACRTDPIKPVFAPTGWKTTALDHITFRVVDAKAEAAFYAAVMGWTLRQDDGMQVVMDMGGNGSAIFRSSTLASLQPITSSSRPTLVRAAVDELGFVITPWNAERVATSLRERGLNPTAENDTTGFESFRFKGPDGLDLQVSNRPRYGQRSAGKVQLPFAPTRWRTVWLDHLSLRAANYKTAASFYENLLGWKPTYDEGSQNQLLMGDVGDIIIRGGNPFDPDPSKNPVGDIGRIDHISLGIKPWDTDGVRAALETRKLAVTIDTVGLGDIHVAPYKSYHTTTPNGYNLQISRITRSTRSLLPRVVKPQPPSTQ